MTHLKCISYLKALSKHKLLQYIDEGLWVLYQGQLGIEIMDC